MPTDTSNPVSTYFCPFCVELFWVECRGRDALRVNEYHLIHTMTALLRCKLCEGAALHSKDIAITKAVMVQTLMRYNFILCIYQHLIEILVESMWRT